jgi:hypothetical protein
MESGLGWVAIGERRSNASSTQIPGIDHAGLEGSKDEGGWPIRLSALRRRSWDSQVKLVRIWRHMRSDEATLIVKVVMTVAGGQSEPQVEHSLEFHQGHEASGPRCTQESRTEPISLDT